MQQVDRLEGFGEARHHRYRLLAVVNDAQLPDLSYMAEGPLQILCLKEKGALFELQKDDRLIDESLVERKLRGWPADACLGHDDHRQTALSPQ